MGYHSGCREGNDEDAMEGSLGVIRMGNGRKRMDGVPYFSKMLEKMGGAGGNVRKEEDVSESGQGKF